MDPSRLSTISTHAPLAGRDLDIAHFGHVPKISTHAPLAGRDLLRGQKGSAVGISTHAPLAGRDNPSPVANTTRGKFQPTRPLRGATATTTPIAIAIRFQPTRPLRGATEGPLVDIAVLLYFNPRAPCGARHFTSGKYLPETYFNPRAPCGARQQKCTNHYAHFCDNRQISDAFAQNAACQGILLLFDAGKPCGFWVRTAQVISAHLCFAL